MATVVASHSCTPGNPYRQIVMGWSCKFRLQNLLEYKNHDIRYQYSIFALAAMQIKSTGMRPDETYGIRNATEAGFLNFCRQQEHLLFHSFIYMFSGYKIV